MMDFIIRVLQDYKENIDEGRWIPTKFLTSAIVGAVPATLFFIIQPDIYIDHYNNVGEVLLGISAVFLTVNGIILALSWGAITKTYEILSLPTIRQHLHSEDDYGEFYFFYIKYVALFQFIALSLSFIFAISFIIYYLYPENLLLSAYFVALSIALTFSIYSIFVTRDLIKTIHILMEAEAEKSLQNKIQENKRNVLSINLNKGQ